MTQKGLYERNPTIYLGFNHRSLRKPLYRLRRTLKRSELRLAHPGQRQEAGARPMHDARSLRTLSVKAEADRDQTVSEFDPIFGIIEEDRLAEQAWDEEAGEKEVTKLELIQDRACMRWQRARERLKATIPTTIAGDISLLPCSLCRGRGVWCCRYVKARCAIRLASSIA